MYERGVLEMEMEMEMGNGQWEMVECNLFQNCIRGMERGDLRATRTHVKVLSKRSVDPDFCPTIDLCR